MSRSQKYRNTCNPYTVEHLRYLEQHYQHQPLTELAASLSRGADGGRFWTEDELDILIAHYPDEGTTITARLSGRSITAVRIMARRLGLKKSPQSASGFRPWSNDEWQRLERNMHLNIAE